MEKKNNLLIGLTFYLEKFLFLSFLALKLREFENKHRTLSNHVPNGN